MPAGATKPETLHTYIVMVDNAADPAEVASDHKITLDHVYTEAAHGFDADMTDAKAAELGADSRVTSVKQDHVVGRIPRTTKPVPFRPTGPSAARSRAKSNGPEQNPDPGAGPPPASIPAQPPQQITGSPPTRRAALGAPTTRSRIWTAKARTSTLTSPSSTLAWTRITRTCGSLGGSTASPCPETPTTAGTTATVTEPRSPE